MSRDVRVGQCQQLRVICELHRFEFFFFSAGNEELLNIYEQMRTLSIYINDV